MREKTEKRDEKIRALRRQGMQRRDIAEEMLCSVSVVDRALRLLDEGLRRPNFEKHREEIITMYKKGVPVKEIAEKTGLSENTINRRMRAIGKGRDRGWKPAGYTQKERDRLYVQEQNGPMPVFYAIPEIRKAERIVIRGKAYLDVSAWYM